MQSSHSPKTRLPFALYPIGHVMSFPEIYYNEENTIVITLPRLNISFNHLHKG